MPVSADKTLEELFKFQLTKLKLDYEQTTGTVSQTVRTAAFGLAALVLPLMTVAPENVSAVIKHHPYWVEAAALLGIFAVMLDIGQNLAAAMIARKALDGIAENLKSTNLEINSPADFLFKSKDKLAMNVKDICYGLKPWVTGIGLIIVATLIFSDVPTSFTPASSASVAQPCQVLRP